MLLYDWNKIFEVADGNTFTIFMIFKMITAKLVPENKYDPIFELSKQSFEGESFSVSKGKYLNLLRGNLSVFLGGIFQSF